MTKPSDGAGLLAFTAIVSALLIFSLLALMEVNSSAANEPVQHATYLRRAVPRDGPMLYQAQHTVHDTIESAQAGATEWEAPAEDYWVAMDADSLYGVWKLPETP